MKCVPPFRSLAAAAVIAAAGCAPEGPEWTSEDPAPAGKADTGAPSTFWLPLPTGTPHETDKRIGNLLLYLRAHHAVFAEGSSPDWTLTYNWQVKALLFAGLSSSGGCPRPVSSDRIGSMRLHDGMLYVDLDDSSWEEQVRSAVVHYLSAEVSWNLDQSAIVWDAPYFCGYVATGVES